MDLVKITELTDRLGISSRSLRYYEQAGLIKSVRPDFEKYRYYDAANIERLKQIMVLRKMEIPVKDIIRIYESADMSVVVETFTKRIRDIDRDVNALTELRALVDAFLKTMIENGVTKISALPLLYEKMEKRLDMLDKPANRAESVDGGKPINPSWRKDAPQTSDPDGFRLFLQARGIAPGEPGRHEQFEFQNETGEVILRRVPDGHINRQPPISPVTPPHINPSDFLTHDFPGGLYASINVYLDEDLGQRFRALVSSFDGNGVYEIDHNRETLLENLLSPDDKRELVSMLVPVKKRAANPALYGAPREVTGVTLAQLEAANPALWEIDVPLDKLTPINGPHYRFTENGEAEYTGWISTRVLNTNTSVRLPFRVDIEFRLAGDDEQFGYGDSEGSIIFYHGYDTGYPSGVGGFGVNMGNQASTDAWKPTPAREEALSFRQPVFRDLFYFPWRGGINNAGYNRVTWFVGEKYLAAVVNGEVRYCGENFPYMRLDLSREAPRDIVVGSNGQGLKYFRKIKIFQLADSPKRGINKEELIMAAGRSNNIISNIHRLVTDEYGENYWFNGCAKYVMECLGEGDYDYQFFAGITGDVFAQYYAYGGFCGEGVSGYHLSAGDTGYIEGVFDKCGYACTFVSERELKKNTEMYLQTLTAYIDKGVPVIAWGTGGPGREMPPDGVFVGYEDYGKTLLLITGNSAEPERLPLETAINFEADNGGWLFVGEKKKDIPLAEIYREAVYALPKLLTLKTDKFCFGAEAFREWAKDIDGGKFDGVEPEGFDLWSMYTSYICGLATNGSCCHEFLRRARELNPDMDYLEEVGRLYKRTAEMWNNDNGNDLEALGGGFNATLEVLQNKTRREKITAKLRGIAEVTDRIAEGLGEGVKKG